MRRYQDIALRTAYLVCPETDADDAVQDAFMKAYDALPRFRDGAPSTSRAGANFPRSCAGRSFESGQDGSG